MKPVVKKYVNACIDCLYNKRGVDENRFKIHVPETIPVPFHTVHLDHLGPFPKSKSGNIHVFGLVDAFSKYVVLKPTRTTTTRGVTKMLDEVTQYFGMPTRITSDRGTAFTSHEFKKYCHENMITHVLTAVKTPRANGQIERYFRTVKFSIAAMTQDIDGKDWDKKIRAIQWALNNLKNSTTNVTPYNLIMTYQPRDILKNKLLLALQNTIEKEDEDNMPIRELQEKVSQRMQEKKKNQAEKFNKNRKEPQTYRVGDLVLMKQEPVSTGQVRKLQPRYKGPYVIEADLGNDRYVLKDTKEMQVSRKPYESVHAADRLKPWCSLKDMDFDEEIEEEEDIEEDEVGEVCEDKGSNENEAGE